LRRDLSLSWPAHHSSPLAICFVQRRGHSLSCFRILGWGRRLATRFVVRPNHVTARQDRDRLTGHAPAGCPMDVASRGRVVPDHGQLNMRRGVFSRARPGTQAQRRGCSRGKSQRRRRASPRKHGTRLPAGLGTVAGNICLGGYSTDGIRHTAVCHAGLLRHREYWNCRTAVLSIHRMAAVRVADRRFGSSSFDARYSSTRG
jgi:hypothetical protein